MPSLVLSESKLQQGGSSEFRRDIDLDDNETSTDSAEATDLDSLRTLITEVYLPLSKREQAELWNAIRDGARSCTAMGRRRLGHPRTASKRHLEWYYEGGPEARSTIKEGKKNGFTRPGSRTDKRDRKQITGTARRSDFRRIGSKTGRRNQKRTLPMTNSCLRLFGNRMAKNARSPT